MDESFALMPPFHTEYGKNLRIGRNVFVNHGCDFMDRGGITIEQRADRAQGQPDHRRTGAMGVASISEHTALGAGVPVNVRSWPRLCEKPASTGMI